MEELISLADVEAAAARVLELGAQAYYFGGAGDEITLRDNLTAWQRLALRPRVLVRVGDCDPGVTLLGRPRRHPLDRALALAGARCSGDVDASFVTQAPCA